MSDDNNLRKKNILFSVLLLAEVAIALASYLLFVLGNVTQEDLNVIMMVLVPAAVLTALFGLVSFPKRKGAKRRGEEKSF